MARVRTITVRGVPDAVLGAIRATSALHRRSLNGELLVILERAAAEPAAPAAGMVRETAATYRAAPRAAAPRRAAGGDSLPKLVDRHALAALCRRHEVTWLAVFGSHARGDARPDSDVDVVVDFAPGRTPGFGIVAVAEALRPAFGGRRVDLVTRRGLRPPLREQVLATAVTLHGA